MDAVDYFVLCEVCMVCSKVSCTHPIRQVRCCCMYMFFTATPTGQDVYITDRLYIYFEILIGYYFVVCFTAS